MPDLAFYQPDIAQNTGAMMRLCACMGVRLHVIEPCGFVWDEVKMRRAGMDYMDKVCVVRHISWAAFREAMAGRRILLVTTRGAEPYTGFSFRADDILLMGRESAGVPDEVHAQADARLLIPLAGACRSLNVATAAAMVLGEAIRQCPVERSFS